MCVCHLGHSEWLLVCVHTSQVPMIDFRYVCMPFISLQLAFDMCVCYLGHSDWLLVCDILFSLDAPWYSEPSLQ